MSVTQLAAREAPTLEVRDASGALLRFTLDHPNMIIGRGAEADIRLDHGMVSRQHAQVIRNDTGQVFIKDLGSRNGTIVNGAPVTERAIAPGDRAVIGPFTLTVHFPNAERQTYHTTRIPVADPAGGRISTFGDLSPPRVSAAHLTTLSDLGQALLSIADAGQRMGALCNMMTGTLFQANWSAVVRLPEPAAGDDHEILCQSRSPASEFNGEAPYLSRSILRAFREKREPILASNTGIPGDVQMSMVSDAAPVANIACPLTRSQTHSELIYVALPPQFGTGEWLALAALAARQFQQAESAWAARKQAEEHAVMERDLSRARQIQMRLVPNNPAIPGLDVAIGFVPCRSVGGDYVDVVSTADGRTLLVVADVCGKGLGAALVAQGLHTMVHASLLAGLGLRQTITNLDRYLRQTLPIESFVTLIAVVIDPQTGDLECVNAGHPRPVVIALDRSSESQPLATGSRTSAATDALPVSRELESEPGLPLGIDYDEEISISHSTHRIEQGELLVLYTDGLSELTLPNGELLGTPGLHDELRGTYPTIDTAARVAAGMLSHRLDQLQAGGQATDDRTFLLARRIPS